MVIEKREVEEKLMELDNWKERQKEDKFKQRWALLYDCKIWPPKKKKFVGIGTACTASGRPCCHNRTRRKDQRIREIKADVSAGIPCDLIDFSANRTKFQAGRWGSVNEGWDYQQTRAQEANDQHFQSKHRAAWRGLYYLVLVCIAYLLQHRSCRCSGNGISRSQSNGWTRRQFKARSFLGWQRRERVWVFVLFVLLAVIYIIYYPLFSLGRIKKINKLRGRSPRSAIVINSIAISPVFFPPLIVARVLPPRACVLIWKICP